MKIDTFLKLYSVKKTEEDKAEAVAGIMKNEKVSYSDKVNRVGLIAKESYHAKKTGADGVEREVFEQNSAAKYMLFSLTLVDLYTTLEIDYKKALEQFEKLNGEVLDAIITGIDQREYKEFKMLLDFACDDLMVNEYEPHAFVREQVERFGSLINVALNAAMKNVDMDQIKSVMEQYVNVKNE